MKVAPGTPEAERAWRVKDAAHSGEMEGFHVSPAWQADANEYVAGIITSEEMIARARKRYGLTGKGEL